MSLENTPRPLRSDVTSTYSTVMSSGADDVISDVVDDEDNRRVSDDDLEHSGSGELPRRMWDQRLFSDAAAAQTDTRPLIGKQTPIVVNKQRFKHVAMTTRRTDDASSSTSLQSMTSLLTSFLLPQLLMLLFQTVILVFV